MENVEQILNEIMNEQLVQIIISNKRRSTQYKKIVIKPFLAQEQLMFQFSSYDDKKVFHKNLEKMEAVANICEYMKDLYKQLDIQTLQFDYSILVSKKGKATIHKKKCDTVRENDLSHNRKKEYILPDDVIVPFLVDLGVQTKEGRIVDKMQKKYRQINRFLEFIQDVLTELPRDRQITIIDFGCGKSYLTFAMYYYLKIMNQFDVKMIGLDLKKDVIEHCNQLAMKYGYDELTFLEGDISSYDGVTEVDMVVTLHACDTATDFALDKAVRWNARVILSVPCCQHELNQMMDNELWKPILKYGLLKERIAALVTDGVRANLLEQYGYEVQLLEFIDMEHTPKNILIRGIKTSTKKQSAKELQNFCDSMNTHGMLEKILKNS